MNDALAMHEFFRELGGNPTSILMIAAIAKKKMMTEERNVLKDLYNCIRNEKDIVVMELGDEDGQMA